MVEERPSAKELLKHRFIRNARKSPRLLERIRERPKFQLKEDEESPRNGPIALGEASGTVKVIRDSKGEGTVRASQGKTLRNAGWDFSIGGSPGTSSGTVRSVVRPPQIRDRKPEVSHNHGVPRKAPDGGNQWSSASGSALHDEVGKDSTDKYLDEKQEDHQENEELSMSGTGTVIVRSSRGVESSSLFSEQSILSSSAYTSFDDVSTSGTVVYRGQHDDSAPRTPKSRLGILERTSSVSEDSAMNLAEAKAAISGGLRKARERSALAKVNRDGQGSKKSDQSINSSDSSRHSRDYFNAQQVFPRSRQASDEDNSARMAVASLSAPLSMLLIPSLKETIADDSEGPIVHAVANSLMDMERMKPGSSEVFVSKLLQQLGSSKESSLKDLQELAARVITKGKSSPRQSENAHPEVDSRKKQPNKELNSNANLSPLARFLLSRWQGQASRDLNPT
ncbi:protein kinase superfamily protein [Actinidia rufa]|uniref:Protein kinase superfamily protein n=1 Tax=Actinidia rufa TaxID=165716 RepID=A0A7J0G4Q6_9ERIC|nr:protein kinase superfamily protein [Actinidia rufa]